jgi:membrane-bound metal-dependent hydrolase YbcI (DUF457 family)
VEALMFAINHAATALLLNRRYPTVPLAMLLLSVQAMEFVWVLLNYLGIERTETNPVVRYVGDIHLTYMPFSHSVLTVLGAVVVVWAVGSLAGRRRLGVALGLGVLSHLLLDLLTHNGDIALGPFPDAPKYGTFLYGRMPLLAFLLELAYGLVCWRVFHGGRALLAVIVSFNLANVSLFFPAVPGPEDAMAGRPLLLVTVILAQIVVTLWAVWWGAGKSSRHRTQIGRFAERDQS